MRRNNGLVKIGPLLAIGISFNIARTFSGEQFRVRFALVLKIDTRFPAANVPKAFAIVKTRATIQRGIEKERWNKIEETTPWQCGFVVRRLTIESLSLCAPIFIDRCSFVVQHFFKFLYRHDKGLVRKASVTIPFLR